MLSAGRLGRFMCSCLLPTERPGGRLGQQGQLLSVWGDEDDSDFGSTDREGRRGSALQTTADGHGDVSSSRLGQEWASTFTNAAGVLLEKANLEDRISANGKYDEIADEDLFGGAGLPCSICSSETRLQTHFAMPCR